MFKHAHYSQSQSLPVLATVSAAFTQIPLELCNVWSRRIRGKGPSGLGHWGSGSALFLQLRLVIIICCFSAIPTSLPSHFSFFCPDPWALLPATWSSQLSWAGLFRELMHLLYSLYARSFQLSILTTSNSSSLRLDPLLSVDILTHIIKKISDVKWELPCLANDNTTNLVCHRLCLLTSHNAKSVPSGQGQPPHPFSHTKDFSPAITPCPPRQQHLLFYWFILILTLYFLLLINLLGVGPHHAAVLRSLSFFA